MEDVKITNPEKLEMLVREGEHETIPFEEKTNKEIRWEDISREKVWQKYIF